MYKNVDLHHFPVWQVLLAIAISLLALLATFYQLYLQRVHNAKSLKPLGQIVFEDSSSMVAVRLHNYGLGPLIVNKLTFTIGAITYNSIKDCVELDPKVYMYVSMDDLRERVILPEGKLIIFEKKVESTEEGDSLRRQLLPITLEVQGQDIYDNAIIIKRKFIWFGRHG